MGDTGFGVRYSSRRVGRNKLFVEIMKPARPTKKLPLLFIHGAFDGSWIYRIPMGILAKSGRPVYALNLRGYYYSKYFPVKNLGVRDFVFDVHTVRKALGLNKVVIAGYSTGGLIAQKYVEEFGRGVAALVLYDPSHSREVGDVLKERVDWKQWLEPVMRFWPDESIISEMYGRRISGAEYRKLLAPFKLSAISGKTWKEIEMSKTPVDFRRITCPVFLADIKRNYAPTAVMARWLKAARYSFEGCSHGSILVGPGAWPTTKAVISWLSRNCPTGYHEIVKV